VSTMPRAHKSDDLAARRAELERELESLMDRVDAHPSAALIDQLAAVRQQVDSIDRRLAASAKRRARRNAA
jgi:hypothetical protein